MGNIVDTGLHNAGGSNLHGDGDDEAFAFRLLELIVAGDSSPGDEAALAAWIGGNPNRQRIIDQLRMQWGAVPEAHDVDAAWTRTAHHLRQATPHAEAEPTLTYRRVR